MPEKFGKNYKRISCILVVFCLIFSLVFYFIQGLCSLNAKCFNFEMLETQPSKNFFCNFFSKSKRQNNESKINAVLGGGVYCFNLKCSGVIVKEFEDVKTMEGFSSPMKNSGIKIGSVITKVNDESFDGAFDFVSKIESSDGSVKLNYFDGVKEKTTSVFPAINLSGKKKLGIWIKDDISATGTLSFINCDSNKFYALGHSVVDFETGAKVNAEFGEVKFCRVLGAEKSKSGKVGELKTVLDYEVIGNSKLNFDNGVVGTFMQNPVGEIMPIAFDGEAKIGKAQIFCTVSTEGARFFDCEIIKVLPNRKNKNLTIRITDKNLIEKTGGIVQGMSGSPIVQNGKIIGVLTHSFVNDPKVGFAILPRKII